MNDSSTVSQKILVLASGSTGNNVFCTPAIRFLRKHLPNAIIDVVALNKLSAEVFENNLDINHCFVINTARQFDKLAKDYTQVFVLNKNALKKLSGIKTPFLLVPALSADSHHAEQLLKFIAAQLGVEITDEDRHYVIGTRQTSENLLSKYVYLNSEILINIHLGCGTTLLHGWKFFYSRRADDKKLWSIDAYIELGKLLHAKIPRLRIVVTGTSNESFLARKFEKEVPNTINLVGETTASDLVALMKAVNLFIAHDCGVFHIAAASNVPIVGLFGPTNPILTGPYPLKAQHLVVKKEVMTDISTIEIAAQAVDMLKKFPKNE